MPTPAKLDPTPAGPDVPRPEGNPHPVAPEADPEAFPRPSSPARHPQPKPAPTPEEDAPGPLDVDSFGPDPDDVD